MAYNQPSNTYQPFLFFGNSRDEAQDHNIGRTAVLGQISPHPSSEAMSMKNLHGDEILNPLLSVLQADPELLSGVSRSSSRHPTYFRPLKSYPTYCYHYISAQYSIWLRWSRFGTTPMSRRFMNACWHGERPKCLHWVRLCVNWFTSASGS